MPGTAAGLHLNPRDPVASLYAAAGMDARNLHAYGGDWAKTLAAYNAGGGAVARYHGVPPFAETQAYVRKILGAAHADSGPPVPPGAPIANPGMSPQAATATQQTLNPAVMAALMGYLHHSEQTALEGRPPPGLDSVLPLLTGALPQPGPDASLGAAGGAAHPGQLLGVHGPVIGTPYSGSHTLYGNWQSDNAIDIKVPVGTPVYARESGVIDPARYGALTGSASDAHLQGLRLNLLGADPMYYAHLSRLVAQPGQHVSVGDLLGYSGSANGVNHLHFAVQHGDPRSFYS